MTSTPTTEERIWAVLSHLSALAFGMGILLPVIGWSEQRRKSKYASFQCLQALGYQSLGYTVWLLAYLLVFILIMIIMIGMSAVGRIESRSISILTGIMMFAAFGSLGIYLILPIIAAVACAFGKDFHYPILGKRLAAYLGYRPSGNDSDWLVEEHEDRWVIAMGHFSVIVVLWGILVPISTWILQGKRNLFLKLQSGQTVVYHGIANLLYFGSGFIMMIGFFPFLLLTGFEGDVNGGSPTGMMGLIIMLLCVLIGMLIILILPLFHIIGQWAGYRTLKGDDYHYPVIGKWVERWIGASNKTPIQADTLEETKI
jgi:uncharacterized Tic20 family protein